MSDLATLILGVDSTQVEGGIAALDRLAVAGAKAEAANVKRAVAAKDAGKTATDALLKEQTALGTQIIAIENNTAASERKAAQIVKNANQEIAALRKAQVAYGEQIIAIEKNTAISERKAAMAVTNAAKEVEAIRRVQMALGDQIIAIEKNTAAQARAAASVIYGYDRQGRAITEASVRMAEARALDTRSMEIHKAGMVNLSGALRVMAAAYITAQAVQFGAKVFDNYTRLTAQLRNATTGAEDYAKALANVKDISNTAQSSMSATATVYARIANALKDLHGTQEQVRAITETLTYALRANGATTEETTSTLLQMSQAFGKGKLDGDEFRTSMEAAPNVMRALAASMGVPFGALKDLAKQGQITNEVMIKAFTDPSVIQGFKTQAEQMHTLGGAWQVLANNLSSALGKFNEATGATKILAQGLELVAKNLNTVAAVVGIVAVSLATMVAPAVLAGIASITAFFTGPVGIIALLTVAAGLALDWAEGMRDAEAAAKGAKDALTDKANKDTGAKRIREEQLAELSRLEKRNKYLEQYDSLVLNAEKKRNRSSINTLKQSLGLASFQPATSSATDSLLHPDFSVAPKDLSTDPTNNKDRAGGYDARINGELTDKQKGTLDRRNEMLRKSENQALEAHRQYLEALAEQERSITEANTKTALARLEAEHKIKLVSDTEYYAQRKALMMGDLDAKQKAYELEEAQIKKALAQRKLNSVETDRLNTELVKLDGKIRELIAQRQAITDDAYYDAIIKTQEASRAYTEANQNQIDSLRNVLEAQEKHNRELGLTKEQIDKVNDARYVEIAQTYEAAAASAAEGAAMSETGSAREAMFIQLKEEHLLRAKIARDVADAKATGAVKEAAEVARKEWESTFKHIESVAHDYWMKIGKKGTNMWKDLMNMMKETFRTTVMEYIYKAFAKPLVISIIGSIAGVVGSTGLANAAETALGAASSVAGSGGGLGSILSGGGSIMNMISAGNAAIDGTIQSFAGTVSQMGFDKLGAAIFQNSAAISNALPFVGTALNLLRGDLKGALGSALGAALTFTPLGPVGGIVGSVIGSVLGGMFGGGHIIRPKYYANTTVSATGSSLVNSYKNEGPSSPIASNYGTAIGNAIRDYTALLGGRIDKAFNVGISTQQKYDFVNVNLGRAASKGYGDAYATGNATRDGSLVAMAVLKSMQLGFVTLDGYIKRIVMTAASDIGSSLTSINNILALKALHDGLADLPPIFGKVKDAIESVVGASELQAMTDLTNATQTFFNSFYSDADKFTAQSNLIHAHFAAVSTSDFPNTREGFKSLVESIDTTTRAGLDQYSSLIKLAPEMDAYLRVLEQQASVTQQAADAAKELIANLSPDGFSTLFDFQRYKGVAVNYGQAFAKDYTSNLGAGRITQGPSGSVSFYSPSGNADLVAEIKSLKEELSAALVSIAVSSGNTARVLKQFDGDGMPATRTLV